MTAERRSQPFRIVGGCVIRAWTWAADASDGISWLVGLSLFASVLGFAFLPVDLHDRNQARALQTNGQWVTAVDVEVRVDRVSGKVGGYSEVDAVRVRLAQEAADIHLENVNAAADSVWDVPEGWQEPTRNTGYVPPLDVRVQRDSDGSVVTAMARTDYEYWTEDNADPEFGLGLGVGGLVATVFLLGLNSLRLAWQARRGRARRDREQVEHERRVAATGRRRRR